MVVLFKTVLDLQWFSSRNKQVVFFSTGAGFFPQRFQAYSNNPLFRVSTVFFRSEYDETSLVIFLKE